MVAVPPASALGCALRSNPFCGAASSVLAPACCLVWVWGDPAILRLLPACCCALCIALQGLFRVMT
jgi:hypothetical protein